MGRRFRFFTIVALMGALLASCISKAPHRDELPITKKIIIAHCSHSLKAPEKNMTGLLTRAIALGVDMVEFDVRRTRDNIFIAYHDEFIQDTPIKKFTYEEIGRIAEKKGCDILTVEEVLKYTRGKIKLDVELKEEGYEKEIIELVLKYFKENQFVITSFHDSSLKIIKDNYPDIKVGLLLGKYKSKNPFLTRLSELFPMSRCATAKADFLVPHWKLLKFGFLARAKRHNMSVCVWTVNDKEMIWKLLHDTRVDGIITDKPGLAVSLQKK